MTHEALRAYFASAEWKDLLEPPEAPRETTDCKEEQAWEYWLNQVDQERERL